MRTVLQDLGLRTKTLQCLLLLEIRIWLDAATLAPESMAWAQNHLRVLSGLYGVLRPLDEIEPYRLEMGSRLKTAGSQSCTSIGVVKYPMPLMLKQKPQNRMYWLIVLLKSISVLLI